MLFLAEAQKEEDATIVTVVAAHALLANPASRTSDSCCAAPFDVIACTTLSSKTVVYAVALDAAVDSKSLHCVQHVFAMISPISKCVGVVITTCWWMQLLNSATCDNFPVRPNSLIARSLGWFACSAAAPQQLSLFNLFFKSVQEFPLRCVSSPSRQRLILLYLCLIVLFMSRESGRISWLCMPRLSVCVAGRALRSVLNLNLC